MPHRVGSLEVPAQILAKGRWGPADVVTTFDPSPFELPAGLHGIRDRWVARKQAGGKQFKDGSGTGLRRWRVDGDRLALDFQAASYFTIAPHEAVLDGDEDDRRVLREKWGSIAHRAIMSGEAVGSPLSHRPQLALSLLTSDGLLVVNLRAQSLAVAAGVFHASIVGGADPRRDVRDDLPLPFAAMLREAEEELAITPQRVVFRYFFLDEERLWQPGLAGVARTPLAAGELLAKHPRDRKEGLRMVVHPDLDSIGKVIATSNIPAIGELALLSALDS